MSGIFFNSPIYAQNILNPNKNELISYSPSTNNDVGEIAYTVDVNHLGGVYTTIPIEIGNAPNGFSPQVSLSYSSMNGLGIMGYGWSISASSVISCVNKTVHYDGQIEPLTSTNDTGAYVLDGQRLLWLDDKTLQTEQGFIKVQALKVGSNITKFTVNYPNGSVGEFTISDGTNFYLTRILDKNGNIINYDYTAMNGHYRLSNITYGHDNKYKVSFEYESCGVYAISFAYGRKSSYNYRLYRIKSEISGNIWRTYTLSYETNYGSRADARSFFLKQIDCSAGSKNKNPLKFYYSENMLNALDAYEEKTLNYYFSFTANDKVCIQRGNYEYGSTSDGLTFYLGKSTYKFANNKYTSGYSGTELIKFNLGVDRYGKTLHTETGFITTISDDLDFTPGDELIRINNYMSENYDKVDFNVYRKVQDGSIEMLEPLISLSDASSVIRNQSICPKMFYSGDFNGDGRNEILMLKVMDVNSNVEDNIIAELIDLTNTSNPIMSESNLCNASLYFEGKSQNTYYDAIFTLDYNGDGKTDLCHIHADGATLYNYIPSTNTWKVMSTNPMLTNDLLGGAEILFGDFHGNGKSSLLLFYPDTGNTLLYVATGNGLGEGDGSGVSLSMTLYGQSPLKEKTCFLQDVDDDGISDIVAYRISGGFLYLDVYYIGAAYNLVQSVDALYEIGESGTIRMLPFNTQNGNFTCRLMGLKGDGNVVSFNTVADNTCDKLMTATISSNGVLKTFDYKRLTNAASSFPENPYTFPYQQYYGGLTVCYNQKVYESSEMYNNIAYSYGNAVMHKTGLGFCGFETVTIEDSITNFKIVQDFLPTKYSVLGEESVSFNGTEVKKASYGYNVIKDETTGLLQILKNVEHVYDQEALTVYTTTYEYDNYGNITESTKEYDDGSVILKSHYSYLTPLTSPYLLGQVSEEISEDIRSEGVSKTITKYGYSTNQKELLNKTVYIGSVSSDNQIFTESFVYDSNGRITSKNTTPYCQSIPLTVGYTYDTTGFLTSETNAKGNTTTYAYNSLGLLVSSVDYKGRTTRYEYDIWGRLINTSHPDGTSESRKFNWASDGRGNAFYGIEESSTGTPSYQVWYDAFEREYKKERQGLKDIYVEELVTYSKDGNTKMVYFPYKSIKSGQTVYTQNRANGTTVITDPYGRNETLSRTLVVDDSGNYYGKVISNAEGLDKTEYYNLHQELSQVNDGGGNITYTYKPGGLLSSICIDDRFVTSYSYDNLNRKVTMSDPVAGSISMGYDSAGHVVSETDARGKQKLSEYDQYGRIVRVEYVGEQITTYTYNSEDQLLTEICNNGFERHYTYDEYSRVSREYITTGTTGQNLIKNFTYSNGNTSSIRYSQYDNNGVEITLGTENYYYTNKHLSKIEFMAEGATSARIVWEKTLEDYSTYLIAEKANNLFQTTTFDGYGRPHQQVTSYNGSVIRNITYSYEQNTGNLLSRSDKKRNIIENFQYDHLNRLIESEVSKNGVVTSSQTMIYDNPTGSILYNSMRGNYGYYMNGTSGYRISTISQDEVSLPNTTQTISYNAMHRPLSIAENGITTQFSYNGDGNRIKAYKSHQPSWFVEELETRYYIDDKYEATMCAGAVVKKYLYLGGDAYSAPAVWVIDKDGIGTMYYICRDHIGSITHVLSEQANGERFEYNFDAWGNRRDASTYATTGVLMDELFLRRGYTSHEHLEDYDLINMNARLFEPASAHFLSPDLFVQTSTFTQGYNRYSYCLNNPLKYSDPSGDFVFTLFNAVKDLLTNTFIKVWDEGINAWTNADNWHSTYMSFKIDKGLLQGDLGQIFSRFTWEIPQTLLGYWGGHALNIVNMVKNVSYYDGATAITTYQSNWGGLTLGSFIYGDNSLYASPHNSLFQHEYGHYLQSQEMGPFYLGKIGIPSIGDTFGRKGDHVLHPVEQDANARAFEYFNKNVSGFYEATQNYNGYKEHDKGWDFERNILNINQGTSLKGSYVDYKKDLDLVRNLRISFRTVEFFMLDPISLGLYNHIRYNRTKLRKK